MNFQSNHGLLRAIAFAADKHRFQTRKDREGTPYINHPIHVALTLMNPGMEEDTDLLIAAILHDTIEDTETTPEEISEAFGENVLKIVLEVTDDKSLTKDQRKRNQILTAASKSQSARKLKLADKICNVTDILHHPPANWSNQRKLEYLHWAEAVLKGLIGTNQILELKLQTLIDLGLATFGETRELETHQ